MMGSRCRRLYERAQQVIPGGTQTISKRPERYVAKGWPAYWDRAEGSRIWDLDGNEYLDYVLALGPILLGYSDPHVNEAIAAQLQKGALTTLQSPLEVEVAEKLIEHIPCAEMVRFLKTGAEATAFCVRVARAYTGREKVISCGYAGSHDWWVAKRGDDPEARGVPACLRALVLDVALGDVEGLRALVDDHGDDLGCIVVEPKVDVGMEPFLRACRELATQSGAVLIMDEIVTGFRMGLGGAQAYFNVTPDLAAFGKAMANGMPLAAAVGRAELMQEAADLWLTTTFGGEALSLASAKATIEQLERPEILKRIWSNGERLLRGWAAHGDANGRVKTYGLGPCPGLRFLDDAGQEDEQLDAAFVERMLAQGILMRRSHSAFMTAAHTDDDIDRTIAATETVLQDLCTPTV